MMRTSILMVFLLCSMPVAAQTADAYFDAAIAAHGGPAVRSVQSIQITGQSFKNSAAQPIVISAAVEGSVRLDYGSPVTLTSVTHPNGRFEIQEGRIISRSPHYGAYSQLDMLSVVGIQHLGLGSERTFLGPGSVSGRETVRALADTGRQQVHYGREVKDQAEVQFDLETGLVAAISRKQYASNSLDLSFILTTAFSDYREVSGRILPFRLDRYLDGKLMETITVDSIEINPVFRLGMFEVQ